MQRRWSLVAAVLLGAGMGARAADAPPELKVVSDFPGGSARVENVDSKMRVVKLMPGGPLERGWVCWWYCKVEGVQKGETLTLDVGGGVWATPDRAAVSLDNKEWTQTEAGKREKDRIVYKHKVDASAVWFAWGPPFVLADARELVEQAAKKSKHATVFELCKSKDGKSVPALKIEQAGVKDEERLGIWVNARQHAWESGGSWVCKGFVDWLLSDDAAAESLRKKATIYIVPIMDVDNVERGAGGKNEKPHDHNRDWGDKPTHPAVEAAMARITAMHKAGKFDLYVDLHNPEPAARNPYFIVPATEAMSVQSRRNLASFTDAATREITGPLKFDAKRNASGSDKYDPAMWKRISTNWVVMLTNNHVAAATLETAWNTPSSTMTGYQRVGKELGLAMERYFREPTRGKP